ncbi:MAG: hypothetical protein QG599_3166, partial [Pseudomonadota bacterium]|nr:hypothetical protein [Pseudomonadota bacterium]
MILTAAKRENFSHRMTQKKRKIFVFFRVFRG